MHYAVVGAGWALRERLRLDELQALRTQLQARAQAQAQVQSQTQAMQRDQRLRQALQVRAQAWQHQRQQMLRLHGVLTTQAAQAGLRVQRWQSDGRSLVLQAWLPGPERVPALLALLTATGGRPWSLQSLAQAADGPVGPGVTVVLQAPWADGTLAHAKAAP